MGRPKGDQKYWNEVIIIEQNKKWKCKHCEYTYSGGFSRIKAHLDKTQGKGISKCSVYHHNQGPQHINTFTSIHPQAAINTLSPFQGTHGMIDTIGGSINHQSNIESSSLLPEIGGSQDMIDLIDYQNNIQSEALLEGNEGEQGVNGQGDFNFDKLISNLTKEEHAFISQLQCFESCGKKRSRRVDDWLDELQRMKKRAIDMRNSYNDDFSGITVSPVLLRFFEYDYKLSKLSTKFGNLIENKPLVLSKEFVGRAFDENVKKMWKFLEDDKVLCIGIHGMGGVGKTLLATYMEDDIKTKSTFKHVFQVTMPQDFTIFKLQHHIAQTIGFKLDADYEPTRATILASELKKLEKSVLILDDVWRYMDLQKLGIPLKLNCIKLIITTRLKHVCHQMDCLQDNVINMYPLTKEEALELFLQKLGHHETPATLSPHELDIAESLVIKCNCLPLGINVMARILKGRNDDIFWWRYALDQFENLEMGQEMTEEVLAVLKCSYNNLIEEDMQKCFLYFALLPDYSRRDKFVMKLIERGVLDGKRSLREIFDKAHVIVDKLIDHSLLLFDKDQRIYMNGLVRNMAWHILKQSHSYHVMVKCNGNLKKLPHLRKWTVDLEAVSLADNRIKKIQKGTSPNCPRLSTLILSDNMISHVPESFFTHMNALTLLDLSNNPTLSCLPNSLSNLKSLTSLVLRGCSELEYIPPLGKLQTLSTLDISRCSIHHVPEGLQNLINLKWLDLSDNESSTMITVAGGVLSGLTNMQYLDLSGCSGIKFEDVEGMTMLEYFAGSFLDSDSYNRYLREIQDRGYGFETNLIHFGEFDYGESDNGGESDISESDNDEFDNGKPLYRSPLYSKHILLHGIVRFGDSQESLYLLPRDLAKLSIRHNKQWVCLCSALSSDGSSSVKDINIRDCTKLKSLFCLSSSCSLCTNIENLEHLSLNYVQSLTTICKEDVDLPQSLSQSRMFSHLRNFSINGCHEIETLLRPELVRQLQNLESISVERCRSMKEIFGVSSSSFDNGFITTLRKLTKLELFYLPQLKIVCKGILICGWVDILKNIKECPKLEGLPEIHIA